MLRPINVSRFLRSRAWINLPRNLATTVLAASGGVAVYLTAFLLLMVLVASALSVLGGELPDDDLSEFAQILLLLPYAALVFWRLARPGILSTGLLLSYLAILAVIWQGEGESQPWPIILLWTVVLLVAFEIQSALVMWLRWGWHRDFRHMIATPRTSLWRRAARYGILRGKTGRFLWMFAWRGLARALAGGALFIIVVLVVLKPGMLGFDLPSTFWHNSILDILLMLALGAATLISLRLVFVRRQFRLLTIAFTVFWGAFFVQSADLVLSRGLSGGACETTSLGARCSSEIPDPEIEPTGNPVGDAIKEIGTKVIVAAIQAFMEALVKIVGILAVLFVFGRGWMARPFVRGYREVRQQLVATASELAQSDTRPPILLLRSFKDDEMFTRAQQPVVLWALGALSDEARIEEVVAEELFAYGPMVALSNPRDDLPPLGAARDSVSDDRWRDYVIENLQKSQLIVCFLGDTEHFRWEVERIIEGGHLGKTLFILPPSYPEQRSITKDVPQLAEALGFSAHGDERNACRRGLVIGPDRDDTGFVCITGRKAQRAYAAAARLAAELALERARA